MVPNHHYVIKAALDPRDELPAHHLDAVTPDPGTHESGAQNVSPASIIQDDSGAKARASRKRGDSVAREFVWRTQLCPWARLSPRRTLSPPPATPRTSPPSPLRTRALAAPPSPRHAPRRPAGRATRRHSTPCACRPSQRTHTDRGRHSPKPGRGGARWVGARSAGEGGEHLDRVLPIPRLLQDAPIQRHHLHAIRRTSAVRTTWPVRARQGLGLSHRVAADDEVRRHRGLASPLRPLGAQLRPDLARFNARVLLHVPLRRELRLVLPDMSISAGAHPDHS